MIGVVALVALAACGGFGVGVSVAARRCVHPWTLQLSPARVWLECPVCGETSPGWDLRIDNLHPHPPRPMGGLWPTVQ